MLQVTKKFEFEAAHFLKGYNGDCARLHGHTYKLEVTVSDATNPNGEGDYIVDFKTLKQIVGENVLSLFDHHNVNDVMPGRITTVENMTRFIADILKGPMEDYSLQLDKLVLYETSNSFATWTRDV